MLYREHLAVNGVRTLGADCTGSYKTNYHTITVTTVPNQLNLGVILQYLITTIFNQRHIIYRDNSQNFENLLISCFLSL
jgi:hypothetical protein